MHVGLLVSVGIFAAAIVAGAFGAMLGLGGGVIVIPVLTVIFHVPIKEAIAASLVTVIATSTSAAAVYVEKHYTNIRLAVVLETATTIGALLGGFLVVFVSPTALALMFSVILVYTAFNMARRPASDRGTTEGEYVVLPSDAPQEEHDEHVNNGRTPYTIRNIPAGMGASLVAGCLSGLLGIGGGIIKVPVMQLVMGVPLRVAIATSNFMIGVTAGTSALVYYSRGAIDPIVTTPAALGVLLGARIGTRLARRIKANVLTWLFIIMLLVTAVTMIMRALRGGV